MLARVMAPAEGGDAAAAAGWRALNRANWDDRVLIHLASRLYDLEGFPEDPGFAAEARARRGG
jgi:hypothetical protein